MPMPDIEPCRSNTKRRKLGSNGSSVLDLGSSSNGNRKNSTGTFGSSLESLSLLLTLTWLLPSCSDGEQQRNQCPKWRFNSLYTMEEIESMMEPGYFDGDRLRDPCCNCDSCNIAWEPAP